MFFSGNRSDRSSQEGFLTKPTTPPTANNQFQRPMGDHGLVCSTSHADDVRDSAAVESVFPSSGPGAVSWLVSTKPVAAQVGPSLTRTRAKPAARP